MTPEVSPDYAYGQLERALRTAASAPDEAVRARARTKAARWRNVVAGMADGSLRIGSRTPVKDTPPWVTPEVLHGGFATDRYLAEVPVRADEAAALPAGAPGTTNRERVNLWYLTDAGLAALRDMIASGNYRVDVPEDAALPVVSWLLEQGHHEAALDLVAELRPLMHRLRLAPLPATTHRPADGLVRRCPIGEVRESLSEVSTNTAFAAMLETLRVWHPLFDRLVALWCETVDGDLPRLSGAAVTGGWPCRTWPADWVERRAQWLADCAAASARHTTSTAHLHPKSNFARLHRGLLACEHNSSGLTGRDVGWIRRALANTIAKHGAPGSEHRTALRSVQAAVAAQPTYAELAAVLAARLDHRPAGGGLPALDPITRPGESMPGHLIDKVARALEAPIDELVARGVIPSGEVLAAVLPQLTARLIAADFEDRPLAALYEQAYAAFRRRRGLLLLDLEHQVRLGELPWIRALEPFRVRRLDAADAARLTLAETVLLALTSFPQAILPNALVRELAALADQAELPMPLVEEGAADIFLGTFTAKWRDAAAVAGRVMANTIYARYYELPLWPDTAPAVRSGQSGTPMADDFTAVCVRRAAEARVGGTDNRVAANGTVLEQSQILTTHNLAVLVVALGLQDRIRELAPELAGRVFTWIARRLSARVDNDHAARKQVKNVSYAWRQAIFFLSFCTEAEQRAAVDSLREQVERAGLRPRFAPAVEGLAHVVAGGRFTTSGAVETGPGRRLLGWTTGTHWCLPEHLGPGDVS